MPASPSVAPGDVALFASTDRKSYVRTLVTGGTLMTHHGNIQFDDLFGLPYGSPVRTHLGHLFFLLRPDLEDLLQHARHETTIIQPKDLGYIAVKMGIEAGVRVLEAGTGSGGLTTWLALLVGDSGQVISYDRKESTPDVARRNLVRAGVENRVQFKVRDIADGFDETDVDALFLDVHNPWDFLDAAHRAIVGGGHFGALLPTMNQVIDLIGALYTGPWFKIQVEEILLRKYKVVPARLRPDDRMVGHTGYLIFARSVARSLSEEQVDAEPEEDAKPIVSNDDSD